MILPPISTGGRPISPQFSVAHSERLSPLHCFTFLLSSVVVFFDAIRTPMLSFLFSLSPQVALYFLVDLLLKGS